MNADTPKLASCKHRKGSSGMPRWTSWNRNNTLQLAQMRCCTEPEQRDWRHRAELTCQLEDLCSVVNHIWWMTVSYMCSQHLKLNSNSWSIAKTLSSNQDNSNVFPKEFKWTRKRKKNNQKENNTVLPGHHTQLLISSIFYIVIW